MRETDFEGARNGAPEDAAKIESGQGVGRRNWAGNLTFAAGEVQEPVTAEEVRALVKSRPRIKALGTRHSFHDIADTPGTHVSMRRFGAMTLDEEGRTVTVGAGVLYGELAAWLHEHGFAIHNLASLPHIGVAGACATATHGSGLGNHCLSGAVAAVEFIDGRGEAVAWTREDNPDEFAGCVVGLGALGVVTRLKLDVVPTFDVAQTVYEELPLDVLERHRGDVLSAGYSVSLFTDWRGHRIGQIWVKRKISGDAGVDWPETLYGARRQHQKLHPLPGHSAEHCTEQMGWAGPWYERLPHFRMEYVPSSGAELQTEYFVPLQRGMEALLAVEELGEAIAPHLRISEIRTVAADDLWMSMAYAQDSLAIHFTWLPHGDAVRALLPQIEEKLAPFGARPHWGKLFSVPRARLRELYPRFDDFVALARRCDPEGKFRNAYLDRYLFGE